MCVKKRSTTNNNIFKKHNIGNKIIIERKTIIEKKTCFNCEKTINQNKSITCSNCKLDWCLKCSKNQSISFYWKCMCCNSNNNFIYNLLSIIFKSTRNRTKIPKDRLRNKDGVIKLGFTSFAGINHGLSIYSVFNIKLHNYFVDYFDKHYPDFEYTTVQIGFNVQTNQHYDKDNEPQSYSNKHISWFGELGDWIGGGFKFTELEECKNNIEDEKILQNINKDNILNAHLSQNMKGYMIDTKEIEHKAIKPKYGLRISIVAYKGNKTCVEETIKNNNKRKCRLTKINE